MIDSDQTSIELASHIKSYLNQNNLTANLPSLSYEILAMQLIDSLNQRAALIALVDKDISPQVCNPKSDAFDPIKAIVTLKDSNYDDACWLSFLTIYTDDNEDSDWQFIRLLYAGEGLNLTGSLTWQTLNDNPDIVNQRLLQLASTLAQHTPKPKFGHHRAYESLKHMPIVFKSYIDFINEQGGHQALFKPTAKAMDKQAYFQALYPLIRQNVYRFGRLSTFEYLCLLGKFGLAHVEPDSCYIADASGPKRGATLLFGMLNKQQLDNHAVGLADYLDVGYQEMEAALCHWQKSPNRYTQYG